METPLPAVTRRLSAITALVFFAAGVTLVSGCGLWGATEKEAPPPPESTSAEAESPPAGAVREPSRDWYSRSLTDRIFGTTTESLRSVQIVDDARLEELRQRGEYVSKAAACGTCHGAKTDDEFSPLSGGMILQDGFGPVHAANITPDDETGIGRWDLAEIMRAIRASIGRDERPLSIELHAPYRWLSDSDAEAIAVFLRSQKPVSNPIERRELGRFERNRLGLFSRYQDFAGYVPNPKRGNNATYGQYLATHVSGCYACHTPQGGIVAEAVPFSGAQQEKRSFLAPLKSLFELLTPETAETKKARTEPALRGLLSREGQEMYFGEAAQPDGPKLSREAQDAEHVTELIESGKLPLGGPDIRGSSPTGLLTWTPENITNYLETGMRPDHTRIDGRLCPWPNFRHLTKDDREAIAKYLKRLGTGSAADVAHDGNSAAAADGGEPRSDGENRAERFSQ